MRFSLYATRRQTRQQHYGHAARKFTGYKTFTGRGARDLRGVDFRPAEDARSNEDLAHRFIVRCQETSTILPAVSTIERFVRGCSGRHERRQLELDCGKFNNGCSRHFGQTSQVKCSPAISVVSSGFTVTSRLVTTRLLLTVCSTGSNFCGTLNINPIVLWPAYLPSHCQLRRQGEPSLHRQFCVTSLRTAAGAIACRLCCGWEAAIADAMVQRNR